MMDWAKLLATLAELKRKVAAPWRSGETPLELRKTLLEEVTQKTVPVAPGQRVLAFNHIRIVLHPVEHYTGDDQDRWVLQEALPTWRKELEEALSERLSEVGCENCRVSLELSLGEEAPDPEELEPGEQGRYDIFFERVDRSDMDRSNTDELDAAAGAPAETGSSFTSPAEDASPLGSSADLSGASRCRPIELHVIRGSAERERYVFAQPKIYIGRTVDVLDGHGRLKRRNHLAFLDDDEISRTVSREHARLLYREETGDYWLVDERSAHGTRLFRGGRSFDVSSRDRRGVRLMPGDEICFGQAMARCEYPRHQ